MSDFSKLSKYKVTRSKEVLGKDFADQISSENDTSEKFWINTSMCLFSQIVI